MNKFAAILLATTVLTGAAVAQDKITVGVSWNNFQEERWKTDEAAIKSALEAAGPNQRSSVRRISLSGTASTDVTPGADCSACFSAPRLRAPFGTSIA